MRKIPYVLVLALASIPNANARLLEDWNYEKLTKSSDLVVIAVPGETKKTNQKIDLWRDKDVYLQGVLTKFSIKAKLKGESESTIDVLHYQLKIESRGPVALEEPPSTLSFKTDQVKAGGTRGYMLFLKAEKDKQYSFVTGYKDPQFSVRELKVPPTD